MAYVQRGAIVRQNSCGTLERVDGSSTYIGTTTLESGKVLTKKFRSSARDDDEVAERWLRWQGKNEITVIKEEEPVMEKSIKVCTCPFSGKECGAVCPIYSTVHGECSLKLGGIGLLNISSNLMKLDVTEPLELLALAVAEGAGSGSSPAAEHVEANATTVEDGLEAYFGGKRFLDFVNLHSKTAYAPYRKFCDENGYPAEKEAEFTKEVKRRFPQLKGRPDRGGCVFVAA